MVMWRHPRRECTKGTGLPGVFLSIVEGIRSVSQKTLVSFADRSYWIPGSYAPALSEKRNSFSGLLKNKGFKEERKTKVGVDAIDKSTTLESNKSLL